MEELQRQGKVPNRRRWLFSSLLLTILLFGAWLWYQATLDQRLEKTYQNGLKLKKAGSYSEAVELFFELQSGHPAFSRASEALFQAAQILEVHLSKPSEALLTYLLIERDYPNAPDLERAQKQVATLFKYRLEDCGQAISAYQKVLDNNGTDSDAMQYEVADCYFRLSNFEQARIEFENLQNTFDQSSLIPEVQYRIAVTYALEGKLPEAEAAYRKVMSDWPKDGYAVEAAFGLAKVLEEQEKLIEALKILEDLKGIYPKEDILKKKTEQIRDRISKKKKAV